jgi:hypothetical protein
MNRLSQPPDAQPEEIGRANALHDGLRSAPEWSLPPALLLDGL